MPLSLIDLYGTDQDLTEEDIQFYKYLLSRREVAIELDRWVNYTDSLDQDELPSKEKFNEHLSKIEKIKKTIFSEK